MQQETLPALPVATTTASTGILQQQNSPDDNPDKIILQQDQQPQQQQQQQKTIPTTTAVISSNEIINEIETVTTTTTPLTPLANTDPMTNADQDTHNQQTLQLNLKKSSKKKRNKDKTSKNDSLNLSIHSDTKSINIKNFNEIAVLLSRLTELEAYDILRETVSNTDTDKNVMIKEILNFSKEIDFSVL